MGPLPIPRHEEGLLTGHAGLAVWLWWVLGQRAVLVDHIWGLLHTWFVFQMTMGSVSHVGNIILVQPP